MSKMPNLHTTLQRPNVLAATHSGSFHADDVLAAAAMLRANPRLAIVRTRDQAQLDAADILFDVGRVFDSASCRFDHHQLSYDQMRENGIPYSSFGLIWRELGEHLCTSAAAASRVDRLLVQGVDAIDCGISPGTPNPLFNVMSISAAIGSFNPDWQDDNSPKARDAAFARAINWSDALLQNVIREAEQTEAARAAVAQGELLAAGRILLLESDVPWKDSVCNDPGYEGVLYVVSPDSDDKWHVGAVPKQLGSFDNRQDLPPGWAGLDGDELDRATGIEGCIFCHKGRFVAGNKTKDGALKMAQLALR